MARHDWGGMLKPLQGTFILLILAVSVVKSGMSNTTSVTMCLTSTETHKGQRCNYFSKCHYFKTT